MSEQSVTLQELIAQRRQLDERINAMSSKRLDAIRSVLKVMNNFAITVEDLKEAMDAAPQTEEPSSAQEDRTASAATKAARKTTKRAAKKSTASKKATKNSRASKQQPTAAAVDQPEESNIQQAEGFEKASDIVGEQQSQQEPSLQPDPFSAFRAAPSTPREYSYGAPSATVDDDDDPNPIPLPPTEEELSRLEDI